MIPIASHNACILGVKMSKMASTEDVVSDVALEKGYTSLCSKQEAILISLPTGSGKSLCYSILPKVFDRVKKRPKSSSIVIVVSPLISLMNDQVRSLATKGITVFSLHANIKLLHAFRVTSHFITFHEKRATPPDLPPACW